MPKPRIRTINKRKMKTKFLDALPAAVILTAMLLNGAFRIRAAGALPGDLEVKTILRDRIETNGEGVGIVAGLVDEEGTRIVAFGPANRTGGPPVDGDTIFEIGSITKVFTSLLLADMVQRGEVALDDPIEKYLPKAVGAPARNGRQITLAHLAEHTSGLPRLPGNMSLWNLVWNRANPYAAYTVKQMYEFLSICELTREIGAEYEYSNFGAGVLGHVLGLRANMGYEALIQQRICQPLGLTNTGITLSPELKSRHAQGHNARGRAVSNWDIPALAGCGALHSNARDMLRFVAANMGLEKSELSPAMEAQQIPRHEAGSSKMQIGLAWHIASRGDSQIIWHNGGTGGYRSFAGFDRKKKIGVVILANSANSVDDIGFHLLDKSFPLKSFKPPTQRTAIQLEPRLLDICVGRYQLNDRMFFNIRRAGDHLQVQLTGQQYLDIFPEADDNFFCKVVDAQISFGKDDQGRTTSLVLHQNGVDQTARKISDTVPK